MKYLPRSIGFGLAIHTDAGVFLFKINIPTPWLAIGALLLLVLSRVF